MPKVLKLGFIGGGLSSSIGQIHFMSSQLDNRWKVVAGAFSRQNSVNKRTADTWNIAPSRVYDCWQSLVESEAESLDAVAVLAPPSEHAEIISSLFEKNIPVISEKPLAASVDQALSIEKTLRDNSGFLAVTFNYSGYPMIRELRAKILKSELGRIRKINFEMPQEAFLRVNANTGLTVKPQSWRMKDSMIPTICLDLGTHLHHLSSFLIDKEPLRTIAEYSNHSKHSCLTDDIMMWLEFDDSIKGSYWMSKSALGHRNGLRIRIYGEEASAEWVQMAPEELKICDKRGNHILIDRASKSHLSHEPRYNRYKAGHPSGFVEGFANLYSDISDALIEFRETGTHNSPYVYGMNHSLNGLKLFEASRISNKEKHWIELNLN